jgi:hypothetical protein
MDSFYRFIFGDLYFFSIYPFFKISRTSPEKVSGFGVQVIAT